LTEGDEHDDDDVQHQAMPWRWRLISIVQLLGVVL